MLGTAKLWKRYTPASNWEIVCFARQRCLWLATEQPESYSVGSGAVWVSSRASLICAARDI